MKLAESEIPRYLTSRILHLILMPTEACNFRCVYCYEDFKLNRMEPWVVRGVRRLLTYRAPELDMLTLSWFGGEPLLARDIIEEILIHVQSLLAGNPSLRFASDITTNAYSLTLPVFERMVDLGVTKYQISFDGPRKWHDKKRVLADGRGTFDRIWQNVVALKSVDRSFSIVLRLHVDKENHPDLPEFIEACEKAFADDPRFTLFVRRLSRLGGPNDDKLPILGAKQGDRIIGSLTRCAEGHRVEKTTMQDLAPVCYASQGNSFLVRANGRLNKCTVALDHPMNEVGTMREDGTMEISTPRARQWMRGLSSLDPLELECPMVGLAEPSR